MIIQYFPRQIILYSQNLYKVKMEGKAMVEMHRMVDITQPTLSSHFPSILPSVSSQHLPPPKLYYSQVCLPASSPHQRVETYFIHCNLPTT